GVPHELRNLGIEVKRSHLAAGDYDVGGGARGERKSVVDLHLSLERGRLWKQIGALRQEASFPYLLIEGGDLDVRQGVHQNAIRGACLGVIGLGVPVLWSIGVADSARWLWLLARRRRNIRIGRDRPVYAQRLKS